MTTLPEISAESARLGLNFNSGWRFRQADDPGAERLEFDDSAWPHVSLPHTFNDVDTFDNWSLPGHRGEQEQWSGRTWYRKSFFVPASWRGRKVFIEFEGARQVAEVHLDGQLQGAAKGGFTPFGFDLTPQLTPGARHVLAVMVDNRFMKDPKDPQMEAQAATNLATQPNLGHLVEELTAGIPDKLETLQADQIPWNNPHWHPAHGGLYRNVRLIVTDPLHLTLPLYSFLATEGPYVYATDIRDDSARIGVEAPVCNERTAVAEIEVRAEVFDTSGRSVLALSRDGTLAPGQSAKLALHGKLLQPRCWEPGYPHVYRVVISVWTGGRLVDSAEVPLGVRMLRWDAGTGLWVNGAHTKLHGWGQKATNEWPGLGAALPDWLQAYTLRLMKDAGGNFVRWGHVPGSPAQVAAADQLGLVTLQPGCDGEGDTRGGAWSLRVACFRDVLIYFRNHPSIFIWEGGNQKVSRAHACELRGLMDRYDPHGGRAYAHRRADRITAEFMDVGIGTEGGREIARLPVVEGEYNREESPRRVWDEFSPPGFGYREAAGQTYQLTSEQFAVNQVAHYVRKLGPAHHAGGANWIFSDSTSGGRLSTEVARASGEVDGVRLPKEAYYVCQVMFTYEPRVHLIGHWNYPAGTRKTIHVAANTGGEVELWINGCSQGRAQPVDRFLYSFPDVLFAPGEIKAVAHDAAGRAAAAAVKRTVGAPVALKITPLVGPDGWRADGADVALLDIEAIDASGARAPTFQQRVDFTVEGPAVWRGGYNSGKLDSINHLHLELECGVNRVALRSTPAPGRVTVRARAAGLRPVSLALDTRPDRGQPPAWPGAELPAAPRRQPPELAPQPREGASLPPDRIGRFTKAFNYSGAYAYQVHLELDAGNGRNAYADIDSPFRNLPAPLVGADWVQVSNRDARYHAVDLMELTVAAGTVVAVAHDDRLPRPQWLQHGFRATGLTLKINGHSMALFARHFAAETGLTLGPNLDGDATGAALMYLVFVNTGDGRAD